MSKNGKVFSLIFGSAAVLCFLFSGYAQFQQCVTSLVGLLEGCAYSPLLLYVSIALAVLTVILLIAGIVENKP